jgi:hypothetical protein
MTSTIAPVSNTGIVKLALLVFVGVRAIATIAQTCAMLQKQWLANSKCTQPHLCVRTLKAKTRRGSYADETLMGSSSIAN